MTRGVLTLAAVAALWALPVLADPAEAPTDVFLTTQGDDQFLARDLILFAKVQDADGQIVGDVEDLILNADNQVVGVVMGTGGFAGFGEKRVGVNLSALQIKNEGGNIIVTLPQATKETLDALPAFERKQPPKSLLDRAIEKAKELTDKGSVTAKDAYEKAKEKAAPALEKAGEVAKGAYDGAKNALEGKPEGEAAVPPAEDAPATEPASAAPSETPAAPTEPAPEQSAP